MKTHKIKFGHDIKALYFFETEQMFFHSTISLSIANPNTMSDTFPPS